MYVYGQLSAIKDLYIIIIVTLVRCSFEKNCKRRVYFRHALSPEVCI